MCVTVHQLVDPRPKLHRQQRLRVDDAQVLVQTAHRPVEVELERMSVRVRHLRQVEPLVAVDVAVLDLAGELEPDDTTIARQCVDLTVNDDARDLSRNRQVSHRGALRALEPPPSGVDILEKSDTALNSLPVDVLCRAVNRNNEHC